MGPDRSRTGRPSLGAFVVLTAATAAVSTAGTFLAARLLTAVGASGVGPIALALIGDLVTYADEAGCWEPVAGRRGWASRLPTRDHRHCHALGRLVTVLDNASPQGRAAIHQEVGVKLSSDPTAKQVRPTAGLARVGRGSGPAPATAGQVGLLSSSSATPATVSLPLKVVLPSVRPGGAASARG